MTTADVLLSDGALGQIRTLEPTDADALHDLHEHVSKTSLWLRFFSVGRHAGHAYVDHVLRSPDTIALVATVEGRVVGLATAEPTEPGTSEVAFLLADDFRGHGLGTLLLEHLAAHARDRGIARFTAVVLAENVRMLNVFTDAGFQVARTSTEGEYDVVLDIRVTSAVQDAADAREFAAEKHSLAPLLAPRSVAVYGARRDGTGIGAAVLTAVQRDGFAGTVVAIHPTADEVAGVPARPSLAGLPPVDLVVIAVHVDRVLAAFEDAARAGARTAVVISSGFGEMGERGRVLQRDLARSARLHGVRLVGPNCLGVLDNDPAVRLNATFGLRVPPAGGLAVASQSGGVGIALMDMVASTGVGVRHFVSLGNKADVSSNDLLAAWYDDDQVTCAALYLESFGNARKFARFARRFSERKPLLAVVGGRSSGGRRAGASHTAAAATPAVGVQALFAQAGVVSCRDAEQLADTALVLTREPLPAGTRVAVLSNAGGLGVLAADAAEDAGLDVIEFSPGLQEQVGALVNQTTGSANPVDAGAGADAQQVAALVEAVLASGEVDAALVVLVATDTNDLGASLRELAGVRSRYPAHPLVAVPLGGEPGDHGTDVTVFASATTAVEALGKSAQYAAWRRAGVPAPVVPSDPATVQAARVRAAALVGDAGTDGWIDTADARDLVARYGVELAGRVVPGDDAAETAAALGFPVAVKLAAADVVHRTEHGLVRTGLATREQVEDAVSGFVRRHGSATHVLVQPMVSGIEMALGVVRDSSLGPLVMVAAGGIATDVWDDRVFLLPPFGPDEARRALQRLRTWPLLAGFRGARPAAVDDLVETVAALGRLAADVPEVAELDLNPVMVAPDAVHVVDLKLRLAAVDTDHDLPRQLRRTYGPTDGPSQDLVPCATEVAGTRVEA
ncbi:MAG TPA: GNAT family N-acetyltransferase [Nocardioides sp.]|nr:GNAT family N-acetyltransferase [Nocardioides sp.]